MSTFSVMADVPNPIVGPNGQQFSGAVLKAFLPGGTISTSIAIDSSGGSPQASITANSDGKWEVTGNEILPYIDRTHKWGIFANATDAAANTPFYMGPFDNVPQLFGTNSIDQLNPATLTVAVADTSLEDGDVLHVQEYSTNSGGDGIWDVVLKSTVTPNTFNIVASTGDLTLALVLRFENDTDGRAFGLTGDGTTDDEAALAVIDGLGGCKLTTGTYLLNSNITLAGDYIFSGGILKPANTITVTITKQIPEENNKIFDTTLGGSFLISDIHTFTVIRAIWFGITFGTGVVVAVAAQNMFAIAEATTMAGKGVPTGIGITPTMLMPVGVITISPNAGAGAIVKSHQTIKGVSDSTHLNVFIGAGNFDVFKVIEPGANSIIFDDFLIDGNESAQTFTHNCIVIEPTGSPVIYSRIGGGIYIKEMSGHGIKVQGVGMDNSDIEPFLVRDNKLGNLFVNACDQLRVKGTYRSSKGTSFSILFDSTGVETADLNHVISEENGGHGLFVSNINTETGMINILGGSYSRNSESGITLDRAFHSSVIGAKVERNSQEGIELLDTVRTSVRSCTIVDNKFQGVRLTRSDDCTVVDNYLTGNSDTNVNSFDAIALFTSDKNNIQGNTIRNNLSTQRYGIAVDDAASTSNLVTNNDLLGSGNTGELLDNGTGTVTVAGNRV